MRNCFKGLKMGMISKLIFFLAFWMIAIGAQSQCTLYTVSSTGSTTICTGATGPTITLSNSDVGISYQLKRGTTNVGTALAGNGAGLSWTNNNTAGSYTVVATKSTAPTCTATMTGSVVVTVNANPGAFTVSGTGSICAGAATGLTITLSGSATGINYQLKNNGVDVGAPLAGSGTALTWTNNTAAGTYTVLATNTTTLCTANMTGSAVITVVPIPTAFTVSGTGTICAGASGLTVTLSGSTTGVNYQLKNGSTNVGTAKAGTGAALTWTANTSAGTYTVVAASATNATCSATMTGSAVITVNPAPGLFTVSGGGIVCSGATAPPVTLSGSAVGFNYQLKIGSTNVGAAVAGTGLPINWTNIVTSATYTVTSTNATTLCSANMTGNALVQYTALPTAFTVTGTATICAGSTSTITLSGSTVGINYQLRRAGVNTGTPVAGTGSALTWPGQTVAGAYTVQATNATTSCETTMTGTATLTVNALPTLYTMTGASTICGTGTLTLGLNSSQSGTTYQLTRDGVNVGTAVSGTGVAISFPSQTTSGTYSILATRTGCTLLMTGTASINALPIAYTVGGGGQICTGSTGSVTLSNSQIGINYQLRLNGVDSGAPLAGTGALLAFSNLSVAGTYTINATNPATNCSLLMTGNTTLTVSILPTVYTVSGGGASINGSMLSVQLSNSQAGVNYQLQLNGTNVGSPISGTGSSLVWNNLNQDGTYTITGTSTGICSLPMSGNAIITNGYISDQVEFNALKDLYNATNGSGWTNQLNWPTTWPASASASQFGTWFGVTVGSGDVTGIQLSGNNLVGTIPTSIGDLTRMTLLRLQVNQLSGPLPSSIGNLTLLTSLAVNDNQLNGAIPSSIGNLTGLTILYLYTNRFTGSIPIELGNLTNLLYLQISDNLLTGSIPTQLGNLSQLKHLILNGNQLSGSIPSTIFQITSLQYVMLQNNQLTGTLPATIGNLSGLQYLVLSGNQLTGELPSWTGSLTSLISLNIANNQFTGSVQAGLNGLANLTQLLLFGNNFTSFPDLSLHPNRNSLYVYIDNNRLSFESIEPNYGKFAGFSYTPQKTINDISTLNFPMAGLTIPSRLLTASTVITWEKQQTNGTWLSINAQNQNTTQATFVKAPASKTEEGVYRWKMTNTQVPSLTVQSDPITATFAPTVDELIAEDAASNHLIPEVFKVTRAGDRPMVVDGSPYLLSGLNVNDTKNVFPTCVGGNYYVGFKLFYDLADHSTTSEWMVQLKLTLLNGTSPVWTGSLQVNNKNQTFASYGFYDQIIPCNTNYLFRIDEKNIVGNAPQGNISIQTQLLKVDDGTPFAGGAPLNLNCSYANRSTNLTWSYTGSRVKEYDLEWVFIASHENFNFTNATPELAFAFKEPARISTALTTYSHQIYYQTGKIWYRVRPVGYDPQYPDHRILGVWSYSPCAAITIDNPEPQKNWQVQTVFAEDGKYKKVVHYFDGTLRTRQSQTNLSTEEITLAGETLYDFEGRKSVEILAAPSEANYNSSLLFKPGLNTFVPGDPTVVSNVTATRKKFNYDNYRAENSTLSTQEGAGRYYSPLNTHSTNHNLLTPDGEGYVFSQTEYLNDGTGRVSRQSGVGKEFKLDGNHATRYFYGSAAKEELTRLFGANVGNASHYKKNMVVDANGQVSISYHDQSDRVIASALAGESPNNVNPLASNTMGYVTFDISNKNKMSDGENTIAHKFLNTVPNTLYQFNYSLQSLGVLLGELGCKECSFDLSIVITDPDGKAVNLSDAPGNESVSGLSYERKNLTAVSCSTNSQVNIIIEKVLAEIGDYTITKTLRPNDASYEAMKTVVSQKASIQTAIQEINTSYTVDASKCDICTTCVDTDGIVNTTINEVASLDCANIRQQIVEALRQHHRVANPNDYEYEPSEAEIQADTLYCKYALCVKDKDSDIFEKQLVRVSTWTAAVGKGYNNLIALDPFFTNPNLSGHGSSTNFMQGKLNDVLIGSYSYDTNNDNIPDGTSTYRGPILQVTDPTNTAYYINNNGAPDVNGKHILYAELMGRRNSMSPIAYAVELDKQRWSLYKNYYLEAKRMTKLQIAAYNTCVPAKRDLDRLTNPPSSEQAIIAYGDARGITGTNSIGPAQLQRSVASIQFNCPTPFSKPDSTTIAGHLKTYFESNTKNIFRLILKNDLTNNNPSITAIKGILTSYGCGLDLTAVDDPLVCLKDTTITVVNGISQGLTPPNAAAVSLNNPQPSASMFQIANKNPNALETSQLKVKNQTSEKYPVPPYVVKQAQKISDSLRRRTMQYATLNKATTISGNNRKGSAILTGQGVGAANATQSPVLIPQAEYNALVQLYNATNSIGWISNFGWVNGVINGTPDVANWTGVTAELQVDGLMHVTKLDLGANRLVGTVPSSIGVLTYLKRLDFSFASAITNANNLTLDISIFSTLTKLEFLRFGGYNYNSYAFQFTGNLSVFSQYTNLKELYIENTNLTGDLSSLSGNIGMQRMIIRSFGIVSGNLSSLTPMTDLRTLITDVPLTGNLSSLTPLTKLTTLTLTDLSQVIGNTSALSSMVEMIYLDLTAFYQINGDLSFLSYMTVLQSLFLQTDNAYGVIPTNIIGDLSSLSALYQLRGLRLSFGLPSQITGNLSALSTLTNLESIDIWNCPLTGHLSALSPLTSLKQLTLVYNSLNCDIAEINSLPNLDILMISNNQLHGTITSFPNFANNSFIVLSYNQISGFVPTIPTNNFVLGLDGNKFTFSDLITNVASLQDEWKTYANQDSVDVRKHLSVQAGGSITLTASVDRNTTPPSTYQWYKYDGELYQAIPGATSYEYVIANATASDEGNYLYMINNTAAPLLTLTSRVQSLAVTSSNTHTVTSCLLYDTANVTLQKFTFKPNFNDLVTKCIQNAEEEASILRTLTIDRFLEEEVRKYYQTFRSNCQTTASETLTYSFNNREYHYTLYYYDQAGNLVQTVPPEGVRFNNVNPPHELVTRYQYNSLNQLVYQITPDAGESNFWYNNKSQLKLSQNAKQFKENNYSYTKYDEQGRIVEVGEMNTANPVATLTAQIDNINFPNGQCAPASTNCQSYVLTDITRTHYDFANATIQPTFAQQQLRTRVAWVEVLDKGKADAAATYYSYDIHGNVKSILQQVPDLPNKRTDYVYDLVSGKVNYVMYQFGAADQFVHRYEYDADNRIVRVLTSTDRFVWDQDAAYKYYLHGPLARIELGQYRVQGLDYYYTLQGWIKGVNSPAGANAQAYDPGKDGVNTNGNLNAWVAKDAFAYNLGYYQGDYKPIGAGVTLMETTSPKLWEWMTTGQGGPGDLPLGNKGLYNGNIAWMVTDLAKIGQQKGDRNQGVQAMQYMYDQLHRIKRSTSLTGYNGAALTTRTGAYNENYTYDANGNILTLLRNNEAGAVQDDFNYVYYNHTNKLRAVKPISHNELRYNGAVTTNNILYRNIIVEDDAYVPDQADVTLRATENIYLHPRFQKANGKSFRAYIPEDGPFIYDAIGNLIADEEEGTKISWTPYGKVREVTTIDGKVISYRYDAGGNRIEKRVTTIASNTSIVTHYVRDASGNVMAIYTGTELTEQPIYGGDRLGQYKGGRLNGQMRLGLKNYELSNHLGNVLTVITDNINMSTADGVYTTVVSATDYYPFGLAMQGRTFSDESYRYGFNGQERGDEISNNHYTALHWEYDCKTGRRWNPDPVKKPWQSEYACFSNSPIYRVDPDGADDFFDVKGNYLYSTKEGTKIRIRLDNKKTILLSQARFGIVTIKTKDGSSRTVGTPESNQIISKIVKHYVKTDTKIIGEVANFEAAYTEKTNDFSLGLTNQGKATGSTDGILDDYNNMKSVFFHEDLHRKGGKEDKSWADLTSIEGMKDHLEVYYNQVKDKTFDDTTEEFKLGVFATVNQLLSSLNFFQHGDPSKDSKDSKAFREKFGSLKKGYKR